MDIIAGDVSFSCLPMLVEVCAVQIDHRQGATTTYTIERTIRISRFRYEPRPGLLLLARVIWILILIRLTHFDRSDPTESKTDVLPIPAPTGWILNDLAVDRWGPKRKGPFDDHTLSQLTRLQCWIFPLLFRFIPL